MICAVNAPFDSWVIDEFTEFTQIYSEDEYPRKELFNEWFIDEKLVVQNKYETRLTKELNRLEKIKNKRERFFIINDKRIYRAVFLS